MATLHKSAPLNLYRRTRAQRLRRRVFAAIVGALALATMAYGETWLLEEAPRAPVECAVATGLALVLESPIVAN